MGMRTLYTRTHNDNDEEAEAEREAEAESPDRRTANAQRTDAEQMQHSARTTHTQQGQPSFRTARGGHSAAPRAGRADETR